MDTQSLSQGTRFFWQGWEYEVKQILPGNKVTIENQASGEVQVVALPTLLPAFYPAELLVRNDDETAQVVTSQGALERMEIDFTPLDVMVVDQRDLLSPMHLLDRSTGYIMGFTFNIGEI